MNDELEFTGLEEIFAQLNGENLESYRANKAIQLRITEESKKYINSDVLDWPIIIMNWDTSKESQRYSMDGMTQEEFDIYYPHGFCLGYVLLSEFDKLICYFSRRDDGELWKVGFKTKLAYLIVYLSEGRKISPLLVKPLENGELIFQGGHHRYAIAKALNIDEIPIYVEPEYKYIIDELLSVKWVKI